MAKSFVRLGNEDHVNANCAVTLVLPLTIFAKYLVESNCSFVRHRVKYLTKVLNGNIKYSPALPGQRM